MGQIEQTLIATKIAGVYIQDLAVITTQHGCVLHVYRPQSALHTYLTDLGKQCAEVYCSELTPNTVNAWKCHTKQQQLLTVLYGSILLVLFDGRKEEKSFGCIEEIRMGRDIYRQVTIPPYVWYGFMSLSQTNSLICNCIDAPHDPNEGKTLPWDSPDIPYSFPKH